MRSQVHSVGLPLGPQLRADRPRGYPIDFRVKAQSYKWPYSRRPLYVTVAQRGLGCYERHLAGEGEVWRSAAAEAAEWLAGRQESSGPAKGAWLHRSILQHTFPRRPPWVSAMAQGEGASLLVRMYQETSDERFAEAAGGVFAIWGCFDVAHALGDARAKKLLDASVDTLAAMVDRYDTGYWSSYDLFPHPVANVATPPYHRLHIQQLKAMALLTNRSEFGSFPVGQGNQAARERPNG